MTLFLWFFLLTPRAHGVGDGATECPCISKTSEAYEALRLKVESLDVDPLYGIDGCKAYDATRKC